MSDMIISPASARCDLQYVTEASSGEEGVSVAGLIHVIVTPVWRCIRAKITIPKISCTPKNSQILNKCLGRTHICHFNTRINIKEIALEKMNFFFF